METLIKHRTCPTCLGDSQLTDWQPPPGFDSHMQEFTCKCGFTFYVVSLPEKVITPVLPGFTYR